MTPEQIERHVDATAATIGLPLDPSHRAGVVRYFTIAAAMAELVMTLPLDPQDEPAPVFLPQEVRER